MIAFDWPFDTGVMKDLFKVCVLEPTSVTRSTRSVGCGVNISQRRIDRYKELPHCLSSVSSAFFSSFLLVLFPYRSVPLAWPFHAFRAKLVDGYYGVVA